MRLWSNEVLASIRVQRLGRCVGVDQVVSDHVPSSVDFVKGFRELESPETDLVLRIGPRRQGRQKVTCVRGEAQGWACLWCQWDFQERAPTQTDSSISLVLFGPQSALLALRHAFSRAVPLTNP